MSDDSFTGAAFPLDQEAAAAAALQHCAPGRKCQFVTLFFPPFFCRRRQVAALYGLTYNDPDTTLKYVTANLIKLFI